MTANTLGLQRGLAKSASLVGFASKRVRSMTGTLTALAGVAGGGYVFKNMISSGVAFEQKMADMRAVIQGITQSEFTQLENKAQSLGRTTQFSASEAAAAMEVLAKAGLRPQQILAATGDALNLAAAGGIDLDNAATLIARTLKTFNLEATKAGTVADVMAKAANSAATDVDSIGQALTFVGNSANQVGRSMSETIGLIAMLQDAGLVGGRAGRNLATALGQIADPQVQARFQALGVSLLDSAGNMRTMAEIIGDTAEAMDGKGMTAVQRYAFALENFGAEGARAFGTILSKGGEAVRTFVAGLEPMNAMGSAAATAAVKMDTTSGAVKILKSAWESLSITVQKLFGGRGMVEWLTGVVNGAETALKAITSFFGGSIASGQGWSEFINQVGDQFALKWAMVTGAAQKMWIDMSAYMQRVWIDLTSGIKVAFAQAFAWIGNNVMGPFLRQMIPGLAMIDKLTGTDYAKKARILFSEDVIKAVGDRAIENAKKESAARMTAINQEQQARRSAVDAEYKNELARIADNAKQRKKAFLDSLGKAGAQKFVDSITNAKVDAALADAFGFENAGPGAKKSNVQVKKQATSMASAIKGSLAQGVLSRVSFSGKGIAKRLPVKGDPEQTKHLAEIAKNTKSPVAIAG